MTREQWYRQHGLKHVTGFVSPADKRELKRLAKEADQSLRKYITRLLEAHIHAQRQK